MTRRITITPEHERRLKALALELPGDVWDHAVRPLLEAEDEASELRCVLCALGAKFDAEDSWIGTGRERPGSVYVVNGQSVCGKHIDGPYTYPNHGLGGMHARTRRDREEQRIREGRTGADY